MHLASVLFALGAAGLASAQEPVDPSETTRFRFGPIRFTPGIALTSVGVDDNVFNESANPRSDTTAAIGPAVDVWSRVGRARITAKSSGQFLYFKTYHNQRGWNTSNDLLAELPLTRVRPFAGGTYVNAHERPGFEIDARARRRDAGFRVGTEWRLSARTSLVIKAESMRLEFDDNESFLGASLANALNRTTRTEHVQFRKALTPLTTFVVNADAIQDRFSRNPARDGDSLRVMSGFELKPFALISGSVLVGVRRLNVRDSRINDFNGAVTAVDARYAIRSTQFAVRVMRDLTYSFEAQQPYYALTDATINVTQRITTRWDVVSRVGRQSLAYSNIESADPLPKRTDHAFLYGGGVGHHLGENARLGFDVNYYRRNVPFAESREYSGLRAGASVSYGIRQ